MSERELPELNAGITGVPVELVAALSAAMANLFGDAPDSWLLDAEDVLAHLRESGYAIVASDRLERLLFTAQEGLDCINERDGDDSCMVPFAAVQLQPGDLDPIDPVAPGEGER